jgi:L-ascorbate metabolism protein UlaG (beta-lactamase superfamily)
VPIVVRRLNLDATWHLDVDGVGVLFDPWLVGSEVDVGPWFHEAWHTGPVVAPDAIPASSLVVVSQSWTDHDHPPTRAALARLPTAGVPGVRNAIPIPLWGESPLQHQGLKIWRLSKPWWRPPAYHAVVVITPDHRAVVHAPHGLPAPEARKLRAELEAMGASVALLAISRVAYLLPPWLGGAVNPGAQAAHAAVEALRPAFVLPVHDEDKREVGLVARSARRIAAGPVDGDLPTDALGPWTL